MKKWLLILESIKLVTLWLVTQQERRVQNHLNETLLLDQSHNSMTQFPSPASRAQAKVELHGCQAKGTWAVHQALSCAYRQQTQG